VIVSLTPRSDANPVEAIEILLAEEVIWDGGDPGDPGDVLDGGTPVLSNVAFDGGSPAMLTVALPDGTDTITLWWSSQGRSDKVPGAIRRGFAGAFAHLDVEAGFDVPTAYEVECFAGTTPLGQVSLGSVVLPWAGDPNGCRIQQPLNPYLNAEVMNLSGSWPSLTWNAPGELVSTQGAVYPSLVGFGPRQAATDIAVDFGAPTREIADRVKATLGTQDSPQLPVWLIRAHQGMLPRRGYVHVQSLQEIDVNMRAGGEWSRFQAAVTEIARPAPGLQITPLSYEDLDVSYADYDVRDAAYASYDAMDADWALAGAAG
jgi:hypothetical protein